MVFHENRLLADDSHEISYLIFFENWEVCRQRTSDSLNEGLPIKMTRENLQRK